MITVEELKGKAASRYGRTIKKLLLGENPFPVRIPYKRPPRAGDPSVILKAKEILRSQSKATMGFGPSVQFDEASTRRFGNGALPGAITFTHLEDLTRYIGKKGEADRVLHHAAIVTGRFPEARCWTASRIETLARGDATTWNGIISVVDYFRQHQKPWIYPRELPLALPTKFLERNHAPIIEILIQVCPSALTETYTTWQDRLGLRSSSELVEGRFLDPALAPHLPQHMLAPVKEWNRCAFASPTWALITENRTSLLTLPTLPGCLALLGKGYAVTRLAKIEKLHSTRTCYWGDIDQHGFEILASIRSRLPQTTSCLMDEKTLAACEEHVSVEDVDGTLPSEFIAQYLSFEEKALWAKCADRHLRLEQEKIPRQITVAELNALALLFAPS